MNPLISIILTTHNQAHCLWRAILSVLSQEEENWELLVIDCGSEDATQALLDEFGDPRIRIFRAKEIPTAEARHRALQHTRGEYIAYLTPDAGWDPAFLKRVMAEATGDIHTLLWYVGEMVYYYDTDETGRSALCDVQQSKQTDFVLDEVRQMQAPPAHAWVHRRELVALSGSWDSRCTCYEDWDLFLRIVRACPASVRRIAVTLVERRLHLPQALEKNTSPLAKMRYQQALGIRYLQQKHQMRVDRSKTVLN